jgi:hypothetical protein
VNRVEKIPVEKSAQPAGSEEGGLKKARRARVDRLDAKLKPGPTRHSHLGSQAQETIRLDRLYPPEIHGVPDSNRQRIAPAAPQPHTPKQAVNKATSWSRR